MEQDGVIYLLAADNKGHVQWHLALERLQGRCQACPLRRLFGVVLLKPVLDVVGSDQKMGRTLGSLATFGILKVDMVAMLPVSNGLCRDGSLEILGLLARARVKPEGSARRRACRDVMIKVGSGYTKIWPGLGREGEDPRGLDVWHLSWHVGTDSRGSCGSAFLVDLKRKT